MKKSLLLFLIFGLFSCTESDIVQVDAGRTLVPLPSIPHDTVTDIYGVQYPTLDPSVIYCGPGWGIKMCRFLNKYDGTIWSDADNYYSEFSDIKFSSFSYNRHFISFFKLDTISSYCEGWKLGEETYNGEKWNIEITKDQEDVFWFDYDYYGTSEEIEYTTTYKYEVIDGLLNFSSTDNQSFIFTPSERNYSAGSLETDEIISTIGCLFY